MLKPFQAAFFKRMATSAQTGRMSPLAQSTQSTQANRGQMINYTPSSVAKTQLRETNFSDETTAPLLQMDRNFNLEVKNGQVYSYPTKYGLINYKFHDSTSNTASYVQSLHFDNQMSDEKSIEIEKTRQFLVGLQIFAKTKQPNALYTLREPAEVLQRFQALGVTTDKPFTLNGDPQRYRLDTYGVVHDADYESKVVREQDWRKLGHPKDAVFLVQGKEYRMDENGRLDLPEDYVHKYEEFKVIKSK